MGFSLVIKENVKHALSWRPKREHFWRYAFMIFCWVCLLFSCQKAWHEIHGRLYYLLDSDMASEIMLAYKLRIEHKLITSTWFYSTELRVFNTQLVFTPLLFLCENWRTVREMGTAIILLSMLASCLYFCYQAGITTLFPAIATMLITPMSDPYFKILLLGAYYPPHVIGSFLCLGMIFHYIKAPKRRTRIALLLVLTLFSLVLGMGGLRQILILYIPLLLTVIFMSLIRSSSKCSTVLPQLDCGGKRLLLSGVLSCAGAVAGWQVNAQVLRHIFHYTSQEGVKFQGYSNEQLAKIISGWMESFGYRGGDYITSKVLFYNAFCFLALLIVLAAYISLIRRPSCYTFAEKVIFLVAGFGFITYNGLYLFTDMVYYTRYNIPTVILLMPVAAIYLYRLPLCRILRGTMFALMTGLMLWCACDYYEELWPVNLTSNYEQAVAAIQAAGYQEGYATFWNANVMTELTNGALDIRVWNPTDVLDDPDHLYQWLQSTDHFETQPDGPVFIFVQKEELNTILSNFTLTEGSTLFENDNYIAYGYSSYDAMRTDFYD